MTMVWSHVAPLVAAVVVISSAVSVAQAQFTEEAAARGIVYTPLDTGTAYGAGVGFVDLNNDTFADIIALAAVDGTVGIWENDGTGHFLDRSSTAGIGPIDGASGICAGDYNNDGLMDIYITRIAEPNALLRNDGGFTFTNVAGDLGVDVVGVGQGCGWCDYDQDGRLDLAVSNYQQTNVLLRNLPTGQFQNVTSSAGADTGTDNSLSLAFFDYNYDAIIDLLVIHDAQGTGCFQGTNHLLKGTGSGFVDVTVESNTDLCIDSMSATIGDIDRNGWPDMFMTNTYAGSALMCNNGNGTFTRCDVEAGITDVDTWGWGGVLLDHNHDGWEDLYVCRAGIPNRLFEGGPTWPMVDVAPAMNVDAGGGSFTIAKADIDHDGDVDLLLANWGEPLRLFMNNFDGPETWAKFIVRGEGDQLQAIGARLQALDASGWQQRQVIAGSNFKSQDELTQHMGFNDSGIIDELRVTWPGGNSRTLTNLAVNATWVIHPTEELGDSNDDQQVTFEDFLVLAGCHGEHRPGTHVAGCEVMDFDGDCDVDQADLAAFWLLYDDPIEDCNENGIPDLEEILERLATDDNGDWIIDDCAGLPGDVNGDGSVGLGDLLAVLSNWGCEGCLCPADANDDCAVGLGDLLMVLSNWGLTA